MIPCHYEMVGWAAHWTSHPVYLEKKCLPAIHQVPTNTEKPRGAGHRIVFQFRNTACLCSCRRAKYCRATARYSGNGFANRIVEAVEWMPRFGKFRRPAGARPDKRNLHLVTRRQGFLGERQSIEESSIGFVVIGFRIAD